MLHLQDKNRVKCAPSSESSWTQNMCQLCDKILILEVFLVMMMMMMIESISGGLIICRHCSKNFVCINWFTPHSYAIIITAILQMRTSRSNKDKGLVANNDETRQSAWQSTCGDHASWYSTLLLIQGSFGERCHQESSARGKITGLAGQSASWMHWMKRPLSELKDVSESPWKRAWNVGGGRSVRCGSTIASGMLCLQTVLEQYTKTSLGVLELFIVAFLNNVLILSVCV